MRFLVDAQLPARLARLLDSSGHDSCHTSELPEGNRTADAEIASIADAEDRVVVTKDRDFRDSHLLRGTPRRLLIVTTGNVTNNELLALAATRFGAPGQGVDHRTLELMMISQAPRSSVSWATADDGRGCLASEWQLRARRRAARKTIVPSSGAFDSTAEHVLRVTGRTRRRHPKE